MGYGHAPLRSHFRVKPVRSTGAFVAKYQPIPVFILDVPETFRGMSRKQPKALGTRRTLTERRPIHVLMHIKGFPVVHSRAAQVAVINYESKWVNQVQPRTGQSAHAPDIAGIRSNFWLEQDDVNHATTSLGIASRNQAARHVLPWKTIYAGSGFPAP